MSTNRGRKLLRASLVVGGVGLFALGAVMAANALGTLFVAGTLSPLLVSVGGVKFFEALLGPIGWFVGGSVMAFVGLGLFIAGLNLHADTGRGRSTGT